MMSVTDTVSTARKGRPSATAVLETLLQAGVFLVTASLPVSILTAGFMLGR